MKKGTGILLIIAAILLVLGLTVPVPAQPSDATRVIIDHTNKVYSAPACFDQADLTNNLEETTLGHAETLAYQAESECTQQELFNEKKPFLIAIFQ